MKKFLILCMAMSLMFFFTISNLAADVNEVDLSSNLSFTFEPSNMTEKSLTLVPFSDLDFSSVQSKSVETVEKNEQVLLIVGVSVLLGVFLHNALVS